MSDKLDENYHIAILDPKTSKILGKEEQFQTLEEALGFLHKFEETGEVSEMMFACLMGLRDGKSEVVIHRKQFHVGNQILRIIPPKRFHQLFWEGFEPEFKKQSLYAIIANFK